MSAGGTGGPTLRGRPDRSPTRYNYPTFRAQTLLLVEGPDEVSFFWSFGKLPNVQLHVYEGKNNLARSLKAYRGVEGFDAVTHVVVVRDADADPLAAHRSVLSQWATAFGQAEPKVLAETPFLDPNGREWTVWIIPDAGTPGDLEALLWQAVPRDDHAMAVEDLIAKLQALTPVPFDTLTKARLWAWLATGKSPLKEMHEALLGRNPRIDSTNPAFIHLRSLYENL